MTQSIVEQADPRLDLAFERIVDVPTELVWTNVLAPGYRPSSRPADESCDALAFTAVIALEPYAQGTRYAAVVIHGDEESRRKHEAMGFEEGWGKALDQLVAMVRATQQRMVK